jgi:hypothetical protein
MLKYVHGVFCGDWKPTDPSRSTSQSLHEKKRAPWSIHIMSNSPKKKKSSILGYTWHKHIFVKWKQLGIIFIFLHLRLDISRCTVNSTYVGEINTTSDVEPYGSFTRFWQWTVFYFLHHLSLPLYKNNIFTDFHEIWYQGFHLIFTKLIRLWLRSDRNGEHCTKWVCGACLTKLSIYWL